MCNQNYYNLEEIQLCKKIYFKVVQPELTENVYCKESSNQISDLKIWGICLGGGGSIEVGKRG